MINKDEDFNSSRLNNNNNKVGIFFENIKNLVDMYLLNIEK